MSWIISCRLRPLSGISSFKAPIQSWLERSFCSGFKFETMPRWAMLMAWARVSMLWSMGFVNQIHSHAITCRKGFDHALRLWLEEWLFVTWVCLKIPLSSLGEVHVTRRWKWGLVKWFIPIKICQYKFWNWRGTKPHWSFLSVPSPHFWPPSFFLSLSPSSLFSPLPFGLFLFVSLVLPSTFSFSPLASIHPRENRERSEQAQIIRLHVRLDTSVDFY